MLSGITQTPSDAPAAQLWFVATLRFAAALLILVAAVVPASRQLGTPCCASSGRPSPTPRGTGGRAAWRSG
ncbi:hypothetical protein GCM10009584_23010 [Ornithinimicrobium humiphilum]